MALCICLWAFSLHLRVATLKQAVKCFAYVESKTAPYSCLRGATTRLGVTPHWPAQRWPFHKLRWTCLHFFPTENKLNQTIPDTFYWFCLIHVVSNHTEGCEFWPILQPTSRGRGSQCFAFTFGEFSSLNKANFALLLPPVQKLFFSNWLCWIFSKMS